MPGRIAFLTVIPCLTEGYRVTRMTSHQPSIVETLDWAQVQSAVAVAQERYGDLQARHAGLQAYLVLASRLGEPFGQIKASERPLDALERYPGMIVDSAEKQEAQALLPHCLNKQATPADRLETIRARLHTLADRFRYHANTEVQLRFDRLNFALIAVLRNDPIVDRERTPSSPSIRICLGTLGTLLGIGGRG